MQAGGLIGPRGILPLDDFLQAAGHRFGARALAIWPTLSWVLPGGRTGLHLLCGAGSLASALLLAGLVPLPALLVCWAAYLSLVVDARVFLAYQWDGLLLEAGFLATFLAPWKLRCRLGCAEPAPRVPRWLFVWLLFRLMFSSGYAKLASGHPTWWSLTALRYHYETQPLPPWTAWFMHRLPGWFHTASCAAMFVVELAVPFLFFVPGRLRRIGAAVTAAFQVALAATGNFAFFNLLSAALCVPLLDDAFWPGRFRRAGQARSLAAAPTPARVAAALLSAVLFAASVFEMARTLGVPSSALGPLPALGAALAPLRTVNSYGLFAVMTTSRPEIVVEGSEDGKTWRPYEFRWKPGDPARRPSFVAPHQPRLDWQMWFAALSRFEAEPWFRAFLRRLLEGSPEVLALLDRNPFPDRPPRYVRAVLYEYEFTDVETRRRERTWWRRAVLGPYGPVLSAEATGPSVR